MHRFFKDRKLDPADLAQHHALNRDFMFDIEPAHASLLYSLCRPTEVDLSVNGFDKSDTGRKELFFEMFKHFDIDFYQKKYSIPMPSCGHQSCHEWITMADYITSGRYKRRIYNRDITFIICTPSLFQDTGSIVALHNLAKTINDLKIDGVGAKLYCLNGIEYENEFCNDFATPFDVNENTIVVYTEKMRNNFLHAENIVRWHLLPLGKEIAEDRYKLWDKDEVVYSWWPTDLYDQRLITLHIDKRIKRTNYGTRHKKCVLYRKHRCNDDALLGEEIATRCKVSEDYIILDEYGGDLDKIVPILNECSHMVSFDRRTLYNLIAPACGCVTVINPIEGVEREQFLKSVMFYDSIEQQEYKFDYGIAYGNSDDELERAVKSLPRAGEELQSHQNLYSNTVKNFVTKTILHFYQKQQLKTVKDIYDTTRSYPIDPTWLQPDGFAHHIKRKGYF